MVGAGVVGAVLTAELVSVVSSSLLESPVTAPDAAGVTETDSLDGKLACAVGAVFEETELDDDWPVDVLLVETVGVELLVEVVGAFVFTALDDLVTVVVAFEVVVLAVDGVLAVDVLAVDDAVDDFKVDDLEVVFFVVFEVVEDAAKFTASLSIKESPAPGCVAFLSNSIACSACD